jgi:hypothetical protein
LLLLFFSFHLVAGIEWDAVELPSQFMENWCFDEKTFYSFAKHYQSNEPLAKEMFEKLKAAKNYQAALQMIRQLFFGALDMELHSSYNPGSSQTEEGKDGKQQQTQTKPEQTPFDIQKNLAPLYTVIPPLPEDRFLCSFSHIFAGGYAAGYYSYKWAEVMSADAFEAFEEAGLEKEMEVRKVGRRFRDTVLSLGGAKHPSEVFRLFRGRDPSPNALLRHSGLIEGLQGKDDEQTKKPEEKETKDKQKKDGKQHPEEEINPAALKKSTETKKDETKKGGEQAKKKETDESKKDSKKKEHEPKKTGADSSKDKKEGDTKKEEPKKVDPKVKEGKKEGPKEEAPKKEDGKKDVSRIETDASVKKDGEKHQTDNETTKNDTKKKN